MQRALQGESQPPSLWHCFFPHYSLPGVRQLGAHLTSLTSCTGLLGKHWEAGGCTVPGVAQCLCVQGTAGTQCPGCSQLQGYGLALCSD